MLTRSKIRVRLLLAGSLALGAVTLVASPAAAYDPAAAAAYAEQWWNGMNPAYPTNVGNTDCANFVSQALHTGGYAYHKSIVLGGAPDRYAYKNWFPSGNSYSLTWTVVQANMNFLYFDNPGGTNNGLALGTSSTADTFNGVGDVFYFDWGEGLGNSHMNIDVAFGTDPVSGWVGDLVDQHSPPRHKAFWSLRPYNANLMNTTVITLVHILPTN